MARVEGTISVTVQRNIQFTAEMLRTGQPSQLWRYFIASARGKRVVHLLHVSKTGGTAVKAALRDHLETERNAIFLHEHSYRLRDVPPGEKAVLFFRHPLQRFVSAFYSRQRCGRPRYDTPWTTKEAAAFAVFNTPNQLACALSSPNSMLRASAHSAMTGIELLKDSFFRWIGSEAYFLARRDDLLFIGLQETLATNFVELKELLGLPPCLALPNDALSSHRNPDTLDRKLDPPALDNLTAWYARDIEFLRSLQGSAFMGACDFSG
jgi:hypothetical protein